MQNYTKTLLALRGKKYALIVLSLLSVCALIWTIIMLFNTQTESKIDKQIISATQALKPHFNTQALQVMAGRANFSDDELKNFKVRVFEYDLKTKEKRLLVIEGE